MSWQQVRGHDGLVAAFGRAVARGRLAHAYLFVGPPGIGKRLFARQLAKTLLCESPPVGRWDSCDRCAACSLVDAGTHPDLFLTGRPEDKVELPIEVIRQLCDDLALKPGRGGRKVAILDDADDLNDESANCFLKTLEEPPPQSVLVVIGTNPDLQLPTIRSRCQVIPFAPLPADEVADVLRADRETDAATVPLLARISGGSPGLARALADPALWEFRTRALEAIAGMNPDIPGLMRDLQTVVEAAGKEAGLQRRRAALVVRLLIDGLRGALTVAVNPGEAGRTDDPDAAVMGRLAERFGEDGLMRRLDRCLEAEFQIDRKVQLVLVLEALLHAMA